MFLLAAGMGKSALSGQETSGPVLLAAEIQGIEKKLGDPTVPPAERRRALIQLARLFELSGNIEGAAQIWNEAAYTDPHNRDDDALLRSAACLIALGELDRAEVMVGTALRTGGDRRLILKARYLGAQIEVFRTGNPAALTALLSDGDYRDEKPGIYYTLWQSTGNQDYRARLIQEFPGSPEALIARDPDSVAVSIAPTAMWLLMPGGTLPAPAAALPSNTGSSVASGSLPAAGIITPGIVAAGGPGAGTAGKTAPAPGTDRDGTAPVMLQTGLFSREENAQALADRLREAGFGVTITRRTVNGTGYWAVGVPPGPDHNRMILLLKDAGFEAFPVY
jgi:tetratricopeptide (TPR) repeat protein